MNYLKRPKSKYETVRQCQRCKTAIKEWHIHHINGKDKDDQLRNKIRLCPRCHDLVQGICDKCRNQSLCSLPKFNMCWKFEDALPPIYFKERIEEETSIISLTNEKVAHKYRHCVSCSRWFEPQNPPNYIDLWCPRCLNLLIKTKDPIHWQLLQDWKASLSGGQDGVETSPGPLTEAKTG